VSTVIPTSIQGNIISGIDQNTARNSTTSGSAGFIGIVMGTTNGLFNVGTVTGNQIGSLDGSSTIVVTATSVTASTAAVIGMYNNNFITGDNFSNNNIGSITINSGGVGTTVGFRGILRAGTTGNITTFNNNTIANVTDNIVGSYAMYGIQCTSSSISATGNVIRNMTGNSTGLNLIVSSGMVLSNTNTIASLVSQNQVHSLHNNSGAINNSIYGFSCSLGTAANVVERNLVHSLTINSTTLTSQLAGILATAGTGTYRNNMVRLGLAPDGSSITAGYTMYGIFQVAGASNVYHNSVYIGGSGVSSSSNTFAFVSNVTTGTREYLNNIFYNARDNASGAGKNYAIAHGGTGATSNNNVLYAPGTGGFVGFTGADQLTLGDWQTATGHDTASLSADPQYIAPNGDAATGDLHIHPTNTTVIEGNGVLVSPPTDDFDGDIRASFTPVDIGADAGNFSGIDLSPPQISYAALGNTTSTANRILATTITDASGVGTGAGEPLIYFRKGNSGVYTSAAATSVLGSSYTFTIDHSAVGGVTGGDLIQYYVAAQDTVAPPNTGTNPAGGSGVDPPGSTPPANPNSYTILVVVATYPYCQDFDGSALGWSTAIATGSVNNWVIGTPAKTQISAAHSAPNAYVTKITGTYDNSHNAYVQSPIFDFSSLTNDPTISFWHNFKTEVGWDAGVLEVSTDGGSIWNKVDPTLGAGGTFDTAMSTGWYNSSSTSGPVAPPKWSGTSTAYTPNASGWINSTSLLTGMAGQADVRFRWRFGSDGSGIDEGWAIDDICVSAADLTPPIIAYTPLGNTCSTSNRTLTATITDDSGVPTSGPGLPVLYWRINAGAYTGATATHSGGSNYDFSFGGGAAAGDVISYYVVAQDGASTPNMASQPSGASGFTANPPAASTPPATPSSYLVDIPTGVMATSSSNTICLGQSVDLFSSPSTQLPTIMTQDLELGLGTWTATNLSSGGTNPAAVIWTIQPNGYVYSTDTFTGNSGTQFIMANSDAAGNGVTSDTQFTSPSFSTAGYSSLSLSYKHYYRHITAAGAFVDVSTNGGSTWTTVQTYSATTGTAAAFASANVNLDAYIGNPSVMIRFRHAGGWFWYWAVDDIAISGTPVSYTYNWTSTPPGFTSSDQNPTGVMLSETTTYTVTVTNVAGCSDAASTTVTVFDAPVCSISASPAATVCDGTTVTLDAGPGFTYLWNTSATTQTIDVTTGGTYSVTVTDGNNCSSTCDILVTVNPNPICSITGPDPVCSGATNSYGGPAGMSSYAWSITSGNGSIPGAADQPTVDVLAGALGSYTLQLTIVDSNGCTSTCSIIVTVNESPTIVSQPVGGTVGYGAPFSFTVGATGGGLSYQWYRDGVPLVDGGTISGATTAMLSINSTVREDSGLYTVVVSNNCGSITSEPAYLEVNGNATVSLVTPPCASDGQLVVDVFMSASTSVVVGGQFFLAYDNLALDFVSAVPGDAPFVREVYEVVNEPAGQVDYAVGINDGDVGTSANTVMARLTFNVLADNCAFTPNLVTWRASGPNGAENKLSNATGIQVNINPVNLGPTRLDNTNPTITLCPPNINVHSTPGSCDSAPVTYSATATDNCTANPTITFNPPSGSTFPPGTTQVLVTATDECGNSSTCTFDVINDGMVQMNVEVELGGGVMAGGTFNRAITFALWNTTVDNVNPLHTTCVNMSFSGAPKVGTATILVPCQPTGYDCITGRDRLHTLRRTISPIPITGPAYTPKFTAVFNKELIGGNLDDSKFIDIIDFGIYTTQDLTVAPGGANTVCGQNPPGFQHADITGNGVVNSLDYSFIANNFLMTREDNCNGSPITVVAGDGRTGARDRDKPVTSITLAELQSRGLGNLSVMDLNQDGVFDLSDKGLWEQGVRPATGGTTGPVEGSAKPVQMQNLDPGTNPVP